MLLTALVFAAPGLPPHSHVQLLPLLRVTLTFTLASSTHRNL